MKDVLIKRLKELRKEIRDSEDSSDYYKSMALRKKLEELPLRLSKLCNQIKYLIRDIKIRGLNTDGGVYIKQIKTICSVLELYSLKKLYLHAYSNSLSGNIAYTSLKYALNKIILLVDDYDKYDLDTLNIGMSEVYALLAKSAFYLNSDEYYVTINSVAIKYIDYGNYNREEIIDYIVEPVTYIYDYKNCRTLPFDFFYWFSKIVKDYVGESHYEALEKYNMTINNIADSTGMFDSANYNLFKLNDNHDKEGVIIVEANIDLGS